ncbi:MAG: hypothetical protein ABEI80_02670, partial [Haloplanus sp.]
MSIADSVRAGVVAAMLVFSAVAGTAAVSTTAEAAGSVSVGDGTAEPSQVEAGATVSNQEVYVNVYDVSADGDTDTYYVEFPNELADGLSPNSANANATSITSSISKVEGYDDDGVQDTLTFATSASGGGEINLNVSVDTSVSYPDGETTYGIDFRVVDSSHGTATRSDVTSIEAIDEPTISNYTVTTPDGQAVRTDFTSSQQLVDITADVTDSSGATVTTLTEGDFSETSTDGNWTYEATYTPAEGGDYTVTLTEASDADGLDGASGQSGTVAINTSVAVGDGTADPAQVSPGTTINNQKVYVDVYGVSADGDTDTYYVEFPDALASGLSPNSASANATSITSSIELVEGYDDDGTDDTLTFATSASGGGTLNLNVSVDTSVDYPDSEALYGIDFRVDDSNGENVTESDVVSIQAGSPPVISNYTVTNPKGRRIDTSFDASEQLVDIAAAVTASNGTTVATLTEGDFSETNASGTWVYEATYTTSQDGDYTVTLTTAAEAGGLDGATGQSGTVSIDTPTLRIRDGSAVPADVTAGTTVDNQKVHVVVQDVSADGDTDTYYVEFPDALASGLSPNSANANATSITSSIELVEGYDDDGTDDTLTFATSASGGGTLNLNVSVDTSVDYPD